MSTKRKTIRLLVLFVLGCLIVFFLGPRVSVDQTIRDVDLPENLDDYLLKSESRFSDIVPGAEKVIVWADRDQKQKTEFAIVFLHGFSATRQEIAPTCDILAAKIGANLFYTRLGGHGRGGEAMGRARANEWLNDVAEAVAIGRRLGDKIILIGSSTGSTLAVWAAMHEGLQQGIQGLVLMSPNFYPANPMSGVALIPWGKQIGQAIMGDIREWKPVNELQAKYWTHRYPSDVVFSMMGLVDLVEGLDLRNMTIPVLVLHSDRDKVISVERVKERYEEIGSSRKQRVTVNNTEDVFGHILCGDILSPKTTDLVVEHIMTFFDF